MRQNGQKNTNGSSADGAGFKNVGSERHEADHYVLAQAKSPKAQGDDDVVKLTLITAAKTLLCFFVAACLLLASFVCVFPSQASSMYQKTGNLRGAYRYSRTAFDRTDKRYQKMPSEELKDREAKNKYNFEKRLTALDKTNSLGLRYFDAKAEKGKTDTELALSLVSLIDVYLEDEFVVSFSNAIDNLLKAATLPSSHPDIVNYRGFMAENRTRLQFIGGEREKAKDFAWLNFNNFHTNGTKTLSEFITSNLFVDTTMNAYLACVLSLMRFHGASGTNTVYDPSFTEGFIDPEDPYGGSVFESKLLDLVGVRVSDPELSLPEHAGRWQSHTQGSFVTLTDITSDKDELLMSLMLVRAAKNLSYKMMSFYNSYIWFTHSNFAPVAKTTELAEGDFTRAYLFWEDRYTRLLKDYVREAS